MRATSCALASVMLVVACGGSTPPASPSAAPSARAVAPRASAAAPALSSVAAPAPAPPEPSLPPPEPDAPPDPPLDISRGGTIAACMNGACAVRPDHRVVCWGMSAHNEAQPTDIAASRAPRVIAAVKHVQRVACGYQYACAIHSSGEVSCWGALGAGDGWKGGGTPSLTKMTGVNDAVHVALGHREACLLTRGGEVACWGEVNRGDPPVPLQRLKSGVTRMAADSNALCIIAADGGVSCSGGAGTSSGSWPLGVLRDLPALGPAIDVSAQNAIACAVKVDGRIACESRNMKLRKGAAAIRGAKRVWISASGDFACALVSVGPSGGGKLQCWGERYSGQLGDGIVARNDVAGPLLVKIPEPVIDAALQSATACARTVSGKIYCWGSNSEWQAGTERGLGEEGVAFGAETANLTLVPQEVVLP